MTTVFLRGYSKLEMSVPVFNLLSMFAALQNALNIQCFKIAKLPTTCQHKYFAGFFILNNIKMYGQSLLRFTHSFLLISKPPIEG